MQVRMVLVCALGVRPESILHLFLQQAAIYVLQGSFRWTVYAKFAWLVCTLHFGEHLSVPCVKLVHSPQPIGP